MLRRIFSHHQEHQDAEDAEDISRFDAEGCLMEKGHTSSQLAN